MTFGFLARCLLAYLLFPVASGSYGIATAETWIVTNKDAGLVYESPSPQSPLKTIIPYARIFQGKPSRKWIQVEGSIAQGFLNRANAAQCAPSPLGSYTKKSLQRCLNYMGFKAGKVDGAIGGSTKTAISRFEKKHSIAVNSLSLSCAATLICSTYREEVRARTDKRKAKKVVRQKRLAAERKMAKNQKTARKLFLDRRCSDLRQFSAAELGPNTVLKCVNLKESEKTAKMLSGLIAQRKCEDAKAFAALHKLPNDKVAVCFKERVRLALASHLTDGSCEKAQNISRQTGMRKGDVKKCFATRLRKKTESQLSDALLKNECTSVKNLEQKLGKSGGYEECLFATELGQDNVRRMFLAAIRYDASNKRAKARLLYEEIMNRFENDDLAIQAALRLVALNDLAISEQARALAKRNFNELKKAAADAKRAAERAQQEVRRQAERAREDAERRAARNASRTRRSGPCGRISIGYSYPYSIKFGRFSMPQGDARVIGINPQAGKALVQYMPAGESSYYTQHVKCSNIP